jgi:hypothetical protein
MTTHLARTPAKVPALLPNGTPDPLILSSLRQAAACRHATREDGKITLAKPIPAEVRADMVRLVDGILDSISAHADEKTAILIAARLRSMPRRSDDEVSASILLDIWTTTLQDPEMTGIIPAWIMHAVCREYLAGMHGKWCPSPGEFVQTCKARLVPVNRTWVEMREYLGAPVEPERSPAEREAMQARVAEIVSSFKASQAKTGEA